MIVGLDIIMNENKICFIICVNDELFFNECKRYICWLEVPEGIEVELLEIREAKSMAAGYNEGMYGSDAKYKVYMHQDCFIVNKFFIRDVISIFVHEPGIGMIGLNGTETLPENGIMWSSPRIPESYELYAGWEEYQYSLEQDGLWEVEGIDGVLMATQYDIPWREDLFDGWDFYDLSQSLEMRRQGYRVVVPVHNRFWYQHDDKPVLSLWNYDKYRRKFIKEYASSLSQNIANGVISSS